MAADSPRKEMTMAGSEATTARPGTDRDGLVLFLEGAYPDLDREFSPIYRASVEYTASSVERMYALYQAIAYLTARAVPGDIVECGVWRGGNCILAARTLDMLGDTSRRIWLYDTFSGMTEPTSRDRDVYGGSALDMRGSAHTAEGRPTPFQFVASLDDVKANMATTGFPEDRIVYVEGPVEETLPASRPDEIALLRLDTDWFESTAHSLRHLYPRLSRGGVLISDDYGDWPGVREAVDGYLAEIDERLLLNRIDNTGRIAVKC
jgi:O-methyltransferase